MEDSLLNKAHREGNLAVKFQSKGQYTEAIQHHLNAASLFQQIREKLPEGNTLVKSLEYFLKFHERQAELDEKIQDVCQKLEKSQKLKMESRGLESKPGPSSTNQLQRRRESSRSFEEPDPLLPVSVINQYGIQNNNFTIRPRSNAEVNEEYQVIIRNLRLLVDKQARELNDYREQINKYQKRIQELTSKLEEYEDPPAAVPAPSVSASVMMRSIYDPREIPEFPPLGAPPECDFLL